MIYESDWDEAPTMQTPFASPAGNIGPLDRHYYPASMMFIYCPPGKVFSSDDIRGLYDVMDCHPSTIALVI